MHSTARFESFPTLLYDQAQAACSSPADTFRKISSDTIECQRLLPPRETAAVILKYDGIVDELPHLVIRFQTNRDASGYIVEFDTYLRVPRRNEAPVLVKRNSARLNNRMADLLRRAGGEVIPK